MKTFTCLIEWFFDLEPDEEKHISAYSMEFEHILIPCIAETFLLRSFQEQMLNEFGKHVYIHSCKTNTINKVIHND